MPSHVRLRCTFQFQDATPKNVAVFSPTFRVQWDPGDIFGESADLDQLCKDLRTALALYPGGNSYFRVTAYNVEGPPPHYPLAEATSGTKGTFRSVSIPPELAVVLSFYGAQNIPRFRGRLYLPAWFLGVSTVSEKIDSAARTQAGNLVGTLAGLGGINVDWGVWSKTSNAFHKAEHWFVSDAWAIQRRRGIKETARLTGTTSG